MKGWAGVILGLTFSATLQVRADEWSKTFKLTGKPELRVETSDANIRISTWEQDTIEAKVTTFRYKIGENGIRIEDHQEGDKVELEVRFPHHNFNFEIGSHHVDIDIHMPREGRINLHTGDGKIDVNSFKGELKVSCVPLPAMDIFGPMAGLRRLNCILAMAGLKFGRPLVLRWPPDGDSRVGTAVSLWRSRKTLQPM